MKCEIPDEETAVVTRAYASWTPSSRRMLALAAEVGYVVDWPRLAVATPIGHRKPHNISPPVRQKELVSAHACGDAVVSTPIEQSGPLMSHKISVEHSFESGHRLPHLGGRCVSLHGHSWSVAVTVSTLELTPEVTVVEFGSLKAGLRGWIDDHLDHATMLGARDCLIEPLAAAGSRVFRFGADSAADAEQFASGLPWPTVEAVAVLLGRVADSVLAELPGVEGARIEQVLVRETRLNTAIYAPLAP